MIQQVTVTAGTAASKCPVVGMVDNVAARDVVQEKFGLADLVFEHLSLSISKLYNGTWGRGVYWMLETSWGACILVCHGLVSNCTFGTVAHPMRDITSFRPACKLLNFWSVCYSS